MSNLKTWAIDPMHSEILFKIKHLVISTVTGNFKNFDGKFVTEGEGFEDAKVNLKIEVKSVDTNQVNRDEHLRSADFFNCEQYPDMIFESTSFTKKDDENYKLKGNLTIKDITKPIELNAEYGGTEKDNYGQMKHGFGITGTVNRSDFGLKWDTLTETGGLMLGEKIKFDANIQLAEEVNETAN